MFMTILQVGLGGAIGSVLRFGVGVFVMRYTGAGFPVAVLPVNVIGSFLMGMFVVLSFHRDLGHLNPFVMTGILGGFTTFSAFSLEAFDLYERGALGHAALYVSLSVVLSILGLAFGVWCARAMWA